MAETITLRPLFGKILSIATGVIIVVCLVAVVTEGNLAAGVQLALPLVTLGYLVWLMFWAPAVEISDGGVRMRNVFRTIDLSWPAIERIDTRYALTLFTVHGRFAAWAAPSSGRYSMMKTRGETKHLPESTLIAGTIGLGDTPSTDSGDAAAIIRRRWESLRDAGHLDSGVVDPEHNVVSWHTTQIVILGVLVLASVISQLIH
jgi:hypothetical protein